MAQPWEQPGVPRSHAQIVLNSDRDPWEMQDEETTWAFSDFCEYRDAGPTARRLNTFAKRDLERKRAEMAAAGTPMPPDLERKFYAARQAWYSKKSNRYRWAERVKAYDAHLDQVARASREKAHAEAVSKAATRHANVAMGLTLLANKRLAQFLDASIQGNAKAMAESQLAEMSFGDLLALAKNGIMLERLVHDMGTSDDATNVGDQSGTRTVGISFEAAKAAAMAALEEDAAAKKLAKAKKSKKADEPEKPESTTAAPDLATTPESVPESPQDPDPS